MDHLATLESQSIYILREAYKKFKNLAMLWSIGKDSTVLLHLARKAFTLGAHHGYPESLEDRPCHSIARPQRTLKGLR